MMLIVDRLIGQPRLLIIGYQTTAISWFRENRSFISRVLWGQKICRFYLKCYGRRTIFGYDGPRSPSISLQASWLSSVRVQISAFRSPINLFGNTKVSEFEFFLTFQVHSFCITSQKLLVVSYCTSSMSWISEAAYFDPFVGQRLFRDQSLHSQNFIEIFMPSQFHENTKMITWLNVPCMHSF